MPAGCRAAAPAHARAHAARHTRHMPAPLRRRRRQRARSTRASARAVRAGAKPSPPPLRARRALLLRSRAAHAARQVPYYEYALDLILDVESPNDDVLTEDQHEMVESAAEMLYGLIHARYILTARGLAAMLEKWKGIEFGRCPRVLCGGQQCLPVGQSDVPRQSTVKVFCPKCEDIFFPRSKYQGNIDGAYFGTTFPHLFLMTYGYLKPPKPTQTYTPRIFGFRVRVRARVRAVHFCCDDVAVVCLASAERALCGVQVHVPAPPAPP
jgi:casein kinase II subunit beta